MANKLPEKKIIPPPAEPEASAVPQSKFFTPLTVFLIILITLSMGVIFFFDSINTLLVETKPNKEITMETQKPTPSLTPTPIILRPDEGVKGNFSISQGSNNTGPEINKVTFNPLDVRKGQTLTITVTLSSPNTITNLNGTLISDKDTTQIILNKLSESGEKSVWSTEVPITDTLWYTYILKLTATNNNGTTSVTVAPRS